MKFQGKGAVHSLNKQNTQANKASRKNQEGKGPQGYPDEARQGCRAPTRGQGDTKPLIWSLSKFKMLLVFHNTDFSLDEIGISFIMDRHDNFDF